MQRATRILVAMVILVGIFLAGVAVGKNKYGTPKSVIHVSVIKWKPEATEAQKAQAIEGIHQMAATIPGIKNIWLKADRVQPRDYHTAFAIEFESRAAADAYVDHPAHRDWEKIYLPIRAESRNIQMTNP